MQHSVSRWSTPQSPEVASVFVRVQGDRTFRQAQEQDGSNVDNQIAHETFAVPKSYGIPLEATCGLNASKCLSRPVGHSRVVGCQTGIAKPSFALDA